MKGAVSAKAEQPKPALSPFRYPGGKAWLAELLAAEVAKFAAPTKTYAEAYAGGAGAAVRLLSEGVVEHIQLNDADERVYSAWCSIVFEAPKFIKKLKQVDLSIATWRACKKIIEAPDSFERFEVGFAAFYLNRTNRSGILRKAGPIGGYDQKGKWKLGARFYRESLVQRAEWLGERANQISISNMDGLAFLEKSVADGDADSALHFIDPPYVNAGSRLYLNQMDEAAHRRLATYLCSGILPHWVVTYDDCCLVRELYADQNIDQLEVQYSLQTKRLEGEVLVRPTCVN